MPVLKCDQNCPHSVASIITPVLSKQLSVTWLVTPRRHVSPVESGFSGVQSRIARLARTQSCNDTPYRTCTTAAYPAGRVAAETMSSKLTLRMSPHSNGNNSAQFSGLQCREACVLALLVLTERANQTEHPNPPPRQAATGTFGAYCKGDLAANWREPINSSTGFRKIWRYSVPFGPAVSFPRYIAASGLNH